MPVKVFFNNSCNICKLEIDHYKKNSAREILIGNIKKKIIKNLYK